MQASKILALGIVLSLFGAGLPSAEASKAKPKKVMRKPYCGHLFSKENVTALGELVAPNPANGFRFGIGTKIIISTDDGKVVDGVFLGRLVDVDYKTTSYMFEDFKGKKNYVLDAERAKILFQGKPVPDSELQVVVETLEQRGNTCATYAVENFLAQLLAAKVKGNGKLAKEFRTTLGHADIRQLANDYYLTTTGTRFEPIFEEIQKKYGFECKSVAAKTAKKFFATVNGLFQKGYPVLLEFFTPSEMITTNKPWIKSEKKFAEDRRFWPPRKKGQRESGGHVIVAVEDFESASGRTKILINDSDWPERPIEWDYEKYFAERATSSGMIAHYCVDKP